MSDYEDSTVTYTVVSSPFKELSYIGSLGVDGLPMMPEDPYTYVEAALQAPSSPDYVPDPEHPPTPEFVLEPVYLNFITEEQPLPTTISPTADSPRYILESDPEEDLKEDGEDLEEDPTDYPTDRYDDDDEEEESSEDEANDEVEDEDKDEEEEEEEHPALADFVPPPVHHVTARMSVRAQTPISLPSEIEVSILLAIPTLPPSRLSPLSSPLSLLSSPLPLILSPLP
nr:hypothetical protein [Tanacetum cinerariifolium]